MCLSYKIQIMSIILKVIQSPFSFDTFHSQKYDNNCDFNFKWHLKLNSKI
jgi:hypothetical protein